MSNPIDEILATINAEEDYVRYLMQVEQEFYQADNDIAAFKLCMEAKSKGHTHPLFDYVIGFCYNNGRGVALNKQEAGRYFRASAEARDAKGAYYDEKHSNLSRVILSEDFVYPTPEYEGVDAATIIAYCGITVNYSQWHDISLLCLALIYSDSKYGHRDIPKAMDYANQLMQSPDEKMRAKAQRIQQILQNSQQPKKKSLLSFFGR